MTLTRDKEGRYIKLKIKKSASGMSRNIASIYVEPTAEIDSDILPGSFIDTEMMAGNMNLHPRGLLKQGVYHYKRITFQGKFDVPAGI